MRENHIIGILEGKPFAGLTEQELLVIRAHVDGCSSCRQAYRAAKVSAGLLKERTAESPSPSPFFHTRVLARLRERQAEERRPVFARLWRTAGALVSSMVAAVVMLAVLSFIGPESAITSDAVVSAAAGAYSAEAVVLNQSVAADEPSDSQTYTTLYEDEEEVAR